MHYVTLSKIERGKCGLSHGRSIREKTMGVADRGARQRYLAHVYVAFVWTVLVLLLETLPLTPTLEPYQHCRD